MTKYRSNLPQHSGKICITDGGMETDLIFNKQISLPEFASYDLLRTQDGYEFLYQYFTVYADIARRFGVGLILETPTWRANPDWGEKIGDSSEAIHQLNLKAVVLVEQIRQDFETAETPIVSSGCIGPRRDGYRPDIIMTVSQAQCYHSQQISTFAQSRADMVSALTLNYINEAIGITLAAKAFNLPVSISFTLETDGKLPSGDTLEQAIKAVDAATDSYPAYFMINCAHPTHFCHILGNETCNNRLRGIRANASCSSHAELDEAEELDDGNPQELGEQLADIRRQSPQINVIGGCCGTDHRHIELIAFCCSSTATSLVENAV